MNIQLWDVPMGWRKPGILMRNVLHAIGHAYFLFLILLFHPALKLLRRFWPQAYCRIDHCSIIGPNYYSTPVLKTIIIVILHLVYLIFLSFLLLFFKSYFVLFILVHCINTATYRWSDTVETGRTRVSGFGCGIITRSAGCIATPATLQHQSSSSCSFIKTMTNHTVTIDKWNVKIHQ